MTTTVTDIGQAICDHNIPKIKLLLSQGYTPVYQDLLLAAKRKDIDILEIFEELGIVPNQRIANLMVGRKNFEVLDWLYDREIYPSKENISDILARSDIESLE